MVIIILWWLRWFEEDDPGYIADLTALIMDTFFRLGHQSIQDVTYNNALNSMDR